MNFPWTVLAVVSLMLTTVKVNANPTNEEAKESNTSVNIATSISDDIVEERLAQLNLPFTGRSTAQVQRKIRSYLVEGYRGAEDILGLTTLYFPIFEHYLRVYNLPEELKYLPIVESSLQPRANSHVGAVGLWQFVPGTARHYGLSINGAVDERMDPYKATEAAVQLLANLYDQFGDWGLALAAYNCGPGRVRQAMRNARCEDFWDVQPYLPRESQQYIPGFIAAAYVANYYNLHGLAPDYPEYDLQDTRTFKVYRRLGLRTLANSLDISYQMIQTLNPSYLQGVVPSSTKGHYVVVPARVADLFQELYGNDNSHPRVEGRLKTNYVVIPGDTIETLAQLFQCTAEDIALWNGLQQAEVIVNQELVVYLPRANARP